MVWPHSVIDNPDQVERLLAKLMASLPLAATVAPTLAATIAAESPGADLPQRCNVTWASYSGDEGGIICKLDFGRVEEGAKAVFVSITHLVFDRKAPLAREIAAYQKHRVKRLRRFGNPVEYPGS
ncbi:MAG: hypothetical protein JWO51_1747 [Rhodospirillales bacterium]|nr:hypothetical protein [Rhodospirillales bacterium]